MQNYPCVTQITYELKQRYPKAEQESFYTVSRCILERNGVDPALIPKLNEELWALHIISSIKDQELHNQTVGLMKNMPPLDDTKKKIL